VQNLIERGVNNFTNNRDFVILCPKRLQLPGLARGKKQKKKGNLRISFETCPGFKPRPNAFLQAARARCRRLWTHLLPPRRSSTEEQ